MYSYFNGKIATTNAKGIVIDVNNIGYHIFVSNPFKFVEGKQYIIYTHLIVKEDEQSLYGFLNDDERQMFLDLISVKGIGPKSALAIVGAADVENLKLSIISNDEQYLQRFPKIGKKSASQIILDLKSKYEKEASSIVNISHSSNADVVEALEMLGYNTKEVTKYLKNIDQSLSTEDKIKEILILMTKEKK